MDEQERIQRRQHIRLIITEILMTLAVLFLVGFLTLVVMGYSFNLRGLAGSGEVVERSGLVQVSSVPTGATIAIDGTAPLLFSTNASRTMLAGEHEIALTKDGFTEWSKKINVTEGLMYRLNYPRLFKLERETEEVLNFKKVQRDYATIPTLVAKDGVVETGGVKLVTVSPNHEKMVIWFEEGLYILNLNENAPTIKPLMLTDAEEKTVLVTALANVEWSGNSERMLAKVNGKWAVINVRVTQESVWLEDVLGKLVVSKLAFESEAGERLLVLSDKKDLYEVNVRDKKLSEVLLSKVAAFDNDGDRVAYLDAEGKLMAYRVGEEEGHLIAEVSRDAKFATMRYFQESYVGVYDDGGFRVFMKTGWPSGDTEMAEVFTEKVSFVAKR